MSRNGYLYHSICSVFIIDQQIARDIVQFCECLSNPLPFMIKGCDFSHSLNPDTPYRFSSVESLLLMF